VFLSEDVASARKMGVTALMNRFCEHGYDVTLISETLGSHLLDYRCDYRLKRLGFDMGVKNCAARTEILAHFASRLPASVFILTDFDCGDFLEYPAVIRAQSNAHRVVCLTDGVEYRADLPEEESQRVFALWENLVADAAAAPDGIQPVWKQKPLAPKEKIRAFIEKKFYYRERQRVSKSAAMQMSPEQVRKAQLLASKMLIAFERICQKHGLRYYVAAGSLLGAARHGGPIPWDDDVDVTMPRPDYERFIRIAQDELPDDMVLPRNNFPYGFHRLQIGGTEITREIRQKCPHGVFLDIVPLDGAAPTPKRKKIHKLLNRVLLNCMNAKCRPLPLVTMDILRIYECAKRLAIKCAAPRWLLFRLWKRAATRYDTGAAHEWVCLPGAYGYEGECFPKEYWGEPAYLRYEGRMVPVMREWEKYLTAHYGDYMTAPPVLCRRTHPFIAIDFGKYEAMTVEEIQKEVEEYEKRQESCYAL